MRRHRSVLLLVLLALLQAPALAQEPSPSALVVVIQGESRYHQPSCPLVTRAGSKVTMMKLSEAATRGLTAHDCEQAEIEQPKKDANASPVFVQPGDKRYHKQGCPRLEGTATSMTLGEAGQKYWPCPVCKPPIRKREKAL